MLYLLFDSHLDQIYETHSQFLASNSWDILRALDINDIIYLWGIKNDKAALGVNNNEKY